MRNDKCNATRNDNSPVSMWHAAIEGKKRCSRCTCNIENTMKMCISFGVCGFFCFFSREILFSMSLLQAHIWLTDCGTYNKLMK